MSGFKERHPLFLAAYFISVLAFTMFLNNPVVLAFALLGGMLFCVFLENLKSFFKSLIIFLPLGLAIALSNPLFSHNGKTVLFFLNNNPITKEALLYGVNLAVMMVAVIYWFKCFNVIFTSDKLLYLFGKLSSKIALLFSSALRFIPLFKRQSLKIKEAQKALGLYSGEGLTDKFKGHMRTYSALITWSLENAVETGASMKARGFGSGKRTSYSLFKAKKEDFYLTVITVIIDLILCFNIKKLSFAFYPEITNIEFNLKTLILLGLFLILYFLPFLIELKEVIKWKYLKSKI